MSTLPPPDPPRLPGGLSLPPLPDEVVADAQAHAPALPVPEVARHPGPPPPVRERRGGGAAWVGGLFLGLLLGIGGGAGAAYYLFVTEVSPVLQAKAADEEQRARLEGQILDIQAQLDA
ncbi:MAG TPA: hypothetical protein VEI97_00180, partial [bacterium]|nr:hypothetical protein [bacterium]